MLVEPLTILEISSEQSLSVVEWCVFQRLPGIFFNFFFENWIISPVTSIQW